MKNIRENMVYKSVVERLISNDSNFLEEYKSLVIQQCIVNFNIDATKNIEELEEYSKTYNDLELKILAYEYYSDNFYIGYDG